MEGLSHMEMCKGDEMQQKGGTGGVGRADGLTTS